MNIRLSQITSVIILAALFLSSDADTAVQQRNGFDIKGALIPIDEILPGGPPRDGIPAIDGPRFDHAEESSGLKDNDPVLGIVRNNIAKAYPIRILNWHEIVNDHFDREPVVVTYCPLCGSGMAFLATIGGKPLEFGVSGLLYKSDVLLYDRLTESLWSQLMMKAVTGQHRGTELTAIVIEHTSWQDWRTNHPETMVLSFATGYRRDYARDPYGRYQDSERLFFPVTFNRADLHPKELVIGLEISGKAKAWPLAELSKTNGTVLDMIGATNVTITYNHKHNNALLTDDSGSPLPGTTLYWFAWSAFHPDSEVYKYRP